MSSGTGGGIILRSISAFKLSGEFNGTDGRPFPSATPPNPPSFPRTPPSPPCALSSSEPQLAFLSDPPERCRTPRVISMAGQAPPPPPEALGDDFLEQIFAMPSSYGTGDEAALAASMALHRSSADGSSAADGGMAFPLGLSLEQGLSVGNRLHDGIDPKAETESMQLAGLLPPGFGQLHPHRVQPTPSPPQVFHGQVKQGGITAMPQPPAPRPRVRARRGQATDPHSIAERQRRERIAERLRALQELVPNTNKTDRAAMLDEILDYVKFLRLQVKVLSMSRLGGAGAVAQLVAEIPVPVEGETSTCSSRQHIWEKWSNDGTERQVAKLMEEDIGAAMQFLQSKALCMMPISLAMAIYDTQHQSESKTVKPELDAPS